MRYRQVSYAYALVVQSSAVSMQTAWRPGADVYETPTVIRVTIELAGVDPEEVDVSLFENALIVEGRRGIPVDLDAGGIYHTAEIRRGSFRAEIALPASVRAGTLEMHCERGILSITLSKDRE
jgi:HSP20 family protein